MNDLRPAAAIVADAEPFDGWVAIGECQDVLDVGPAPLVDGLVIVAHHAELGRWADEELNQRLLGLVDILVFVNYQMLQN